MAIIAFAGSLCAAPTTAQIRDPLPTPPAMPEPIPARITVIAPRRDPFAGGFLVASLSRMRTSNDAAVSTARLPPIPAVLAALPPNAGAPMTPFSATPAERVSAVTTGAHPFALLEDGSTARLVSIGERYAGHRISAIDQTGVHLDDGTVLRLSLRPSFATPDLGGQHQ
jgi:hypothetical protein